MWTKGAIAPFCNFVQLRTHYMPLYATNVSQLRSFLLFVCIIWFYYFINFLEDTKIDQTEQKYYPKTARLM